MTLHPIDPPRVFGGIVTEVDHADVLRSLDGVTR